MNKKTLIVSGGIIVLLLIGILVLNKKKPASKTVNDPNARDFETVQVPDSKETINNTPTKIITIIPTLPNNPLSQDSVKKEITPSPTQTPTSIPTQAPTLTPIPTSTPILIPTSTPAPTLIPTNVPTATPTINDTIYPTGVSLSATLANLYPGDQQQITAKIDPDNASDKNITWSSNDSRIAIVDNNGLITAINSGVTNIVAKTSNNKTTNVKIVVFQREIPTPTTGQIRPDSISLNVKNVLLSPNKRQQITVNFIPKETNIKTITWSSNNSTVASVSNNGLVTSLKPGTAVIVAKTSNGKTATANITVPGASSVAPTKPSNPTSKPTTKPTSAPTLTPTIMPTKTTVPGIISHESYGGMQYILYLPGNYTSSTEWPLLIYLHGWETAPSINNMYKQGHIPRLLKDGNNFNAIIIAPFSSVDWSYSSAQNKAKTIIDYVISKYKINKSKISITSHSNGCFAGVGLVKNNPTFFSAFVPIASSKTSNSPSGLTSTKLWYFYGTRDVPATNRTPLINAINNAGGDAKITAVSGGHNIMKEVYLDHKMIEWMLTQSR